MALLLPSPLAVRTPDQAKDEPRRHWSSPLPLLLPTVARWTLGTGSALCGSRMPPTPRCQSPSVTRCSRHISPPGRFPSCSPARWRGTGLMLPRQCRWCRRHRLQSRWSHSGLPRSARGQGTSSRCKSASQSGVSKKKGWKKEKKFQTMTKLPQ